MVRLGFVIPVLNQMQLALETVESIRTDHEWQFYLERNYIDNKGVAKAWNIGTRRAIEDGADVVFVLNDDIVLGKDTVDQLVTHTTSGLYGVVTGCDHRNTHTPAEIFNLENPNYEIDIIDAPDFACFAFSKTTWEIVGEFDENFYPAYFEDNDYVYRCLLAGRQPVRSQNSPFYHYGSRTQNAGGKQVVPSNQFVKNRAYYVSKWGGFPGQETFKTPFNNPDLGWQNW